MADTTHTIGSTGIVKKLVDLGDGTYADAVSTVDGRFTATELVLAAGTGSTGGLGKIGTVPDDGWMYVRCPSSGYRTVDWRVQSTKIHDIQMYKAQSIVDEVTLTFGSFVDTETFVLNGLTYTGEETAGDAAYASRKFLTAVGDSQDAAAAAALINADYAVATAGTSVAATDKLTIVTDEGSHVIVAAATADYPAGKYALNVTAATELASIVLAINHKDNVTCAAVAANDTVTVNGLVFTAHATTTTAASRQFAINGDNDADAAQLVVCLNDATYGVPGLTAVAAANVVSFTRDTADDTVTLTSSNTTRLKTEAGGGVPGVIAAATGATAELSITPTWTTVLTVAEAGNRLTVTDIDCPGVYATSADAVVTLVPGTPATGGELATVIHAVDASSHAAVSTAATLAGLVIDGAAVADQAANNTTAGKIHEQTVAGYEYCYLGVMNDSGDASVATMVVGATLKV